MGRLQKLTAGAGLRLGSHEQAMSGYHRSSLEGDHLHSLLRHRPRGQRHEQGHDAIHDVTDPAAQNDFVLQ